MNLAKVQAAIVWKARSLIGTPYVYGVTDCEWLTRTCAAYVGVTIPWGASEQYDDKSLPHVTGALEPGDFVYFHDIGDPPGEDHCGVFVSNSVMIDAPYTGTSVRYDWFSITKPTGTLVYTGAIRVVTLVATPEPRESDDDMAKIYVAQGSTAPYLVGGVPVVKEYLPNVKCEALLGLGYSITRDVNAAFLNAIPDVPNAASPEEVLPVAEPPAAEAPAEVSAVPEEPIIAKVINDAPKEEATTVPETAEVTPDPLPKPGDPGWRQTAS
jgi:hypothetical protein